MPALRSLVQVPVVDETTLEDAFMQHPLLVYSALQEFASVPTRRYDVLPQHPDPLPVDVTREYVMVGESDKYRPAPASKFTLPPTRVDPPILSSRVRAVDGAVTGVLRPWRTQLT